MDARTKDLSAANNMLRQLVADREVLLMEVNHRAKNSLSIASSILGIHAATHPDPTARALFDEAQSRLAAMGRAHDILSQSAAIQSVSLRSYGTDLCAALQQSFAQGTRYAMDTTSLVPAMDHQ